MTEYYVVRNKDTGLYFRGKGVNKWGKQYNQASIYRIKANAENTVIEEGRRGIKAEVVPIQISEIKTGKWLPTNIPSYFGGIIYKCSECGAQDGDHSSILGRYCWRCGVKMNTQ